MHIGTIKQWNAEKAYGFIQPENESEDVFFHLSQWLENIPPQQGQRVCFEIQQKADGRFAAQAVRFIQDHLVPNQNSQIPAKAKWFNSLLIAILLLIAAIFGIEFFTLSGETNHANAQHSAIATPHHAAMQDSALTQTLSLIAQGGPFPYPEHDGKIFHNREGLLPHKATGYYREYTVPTAGVSNRGKKRVITGGNPPEVYYYTEDHYHSFRQLEKNP